MSMPQLDRQLEELFPGYGYQATARGICALYLALAAIRSFRGTGEVIVPATVCPSVPLAVHYAGLTVRYCDVELETFCVSPATVRSSLSNETVAIIVVHLFGKSVDVESIRKIADGKGILLVEDLAHNIGSKKNGVALGNSADFSILSFNDAKILPGSSGGLLVKDVAILKYTRELERNLPEPLPSLVRRELALGFRNLTHGLFDTLRAGGMVKESIFLKDLAEHYRSLFVHRLDHNDNLASAQAHALLALNNEFQKRRKRYLQYTGALDESVSYVRFDSDEICWRLPVLLNTHNEQLDLISSLRQKKILVSNHYFPTSHVFGDNTPASAWEIGLRAVNFWVDGKTTPTQIENICNELNQIFSIKHSNQ